jgi:hypothetical protein
MIQVPQKRITEMTRGERTYGEAHWRQFLIAADEIGTPSFGFLFSFDS